MLTVAHRLALPVAVFALIVAACASGDDSGPLADGGEASENPSADQDGSSAPEATAGGDLDWAACPAAVDAECAELEVPVDYEDPDGETLSLSITRIPASGDRIGPLFVNPGGPGGEAGEFASFMASDLPSEITEHFDIIGMDPRGTGASAIDCGMDFAELYGVDPTIDSPEDKDALLDISAEYVEDCESQAGDLLAHLGTRDVARDMDAVRAAMGDEQLNYLGVSYGTSIGLVYAELFPERIRSMIIDGVVDVGSPGVEQATFQASGFERALQSFADDCDARSSCVLAPDTMGAIEDLIAEVEQEPIPASPRDLGPGELSLALAQPLYNQAYWPQFELAIDAALDGDGSGLVALADDYLAFGGFDVYFAVNCLDSEWPRDTDEFLADGAEAAQEAPHFGEAIVNDYIRCATWPVEPDPLSPVTAPEAPPIMVVSTTNDPATPYEAGVDAAERLENGALLTFEGEGHGAVPQGGSCVDEAVTAYILDLEPPEDGATCT